MKLCFRKSFCCESQSNRKENLLRFFALIVVIGVELLVLVSLHPPDFRYRQFIYGKENFTTDEKTKNKNEALRRNRGQSRDDRSIHTSSSDASSANTSIVLPLEMFRSSCSQLEFSFAAPVLEPRFSDEEKDLFLLVFVISGSGRTSFQDRRNVIRSTWLMNDAKNSSWLKWKHVFLLGNSNNGDQIYSDIEREARFHNDILILNFTDSYDNLVIKVLSGFRWAFMQGRTRYILKADDDVFVRIPRLIAWLDEYGSSKFYGGYVYRNGKAVRRFNSSDQDNLLSTDCYSKERFPPYSAGPFYVVSLDAIPPLFQGMQEWKVFPVEDAFMGLLAHTSNINPVKIPGFHIYDDVTSPGSCLMLASIAFGHRYDSADLHSIQRRLEMAEGVCALSKALSTTCFILLCLAFLFSIVMALSQAMKVLQLYIF